MAQPLGVNDGVLLVSLLYSCTDLLCEWGLFAGCARPIHRWLLVSYGCVIGFRLMHLLGTHAASGPGGDFLLDLRHKARVPRLLASFTWAVALPFFLGWTLLGTSWLWRVARDTPQCVPTPLHLWFAGLWLLLCYVWATIHAALGTVAWVLERRVRRAEQDLQQLEDPETLERWGPQPAPGCRDLPRGLSAEEIRGLPEECCAEPGECAICIGELRPGEGLRRLHCGHAFHRGCIDLWLLRRADCPLCKREVRH